MRKTIRPGAAASFIPSSPAGAPGTDPQVAGADEEEALGRHGVCSGTTGGCVNCRVLVADVPAMDERYRAILPSAEVRCVRSMGEASRVLDVREFDLLIVGVHFDESRMFELLWLARAKSLATPVVCTRGCQIQAALSSVAGLGMAARCLGASDFIDFRDYPDDADGNAGIKQRLLDCMAGKGPRAERAA